MSFEAGFVAAYCALLLLGAVGLVRLGRVNTSPWASRALAGHRREQPEPRERKPSTWPHSEMPTLHSTVAAVAAAAATLLATAELARQHQPLEAAVLGAVAGFAALHTIKTLRSLVRPRRELDGEHDSGTSHG
ncbi:MAG: hypothetical protein ABIO67_02340 [Mycobacteriales bacterium]